MDVAVTAKRVRWPFRLQLRHGQLHRFAEELLHLNRHRLERTSALLWRSHRRSLLLWWTTMSLLSQPPGDKFISRRRDVLTAARCFLSLSLPYSLLFLSNSLCLFLSFLAFPINVFSTFSIPFSLNSLVSSLHFLLLFFSFELFLS